MADFVRATWRNKSDAAYNAATDPHLTADNLNRLEAGLLDVVQRWKTGTLAARPAANAASKFWAYFATDDSPPAVYVNFDGANWTKVATIGGGTGGSTGPNIVRGRINSDGTILHGTGFTVARSALGTYVATFSTAFAHVPAVTVTIGATAGVIGTRLSAGPTVNGFTVITFNPSNGNSVDAIIEFHAIETA